MSLTVGSRTAVVKDSLELLLHASETGHLLFSEVITEKTFIRNRWRDIPIQLFSLFKASVTLRIRGNDEKAQYVSFCYWDSGAYAPYVATFVPKLIEVWHVAIVKTNVLQDVDKLCLRFDEYDYKTAVDRN